MTVYGTFLYKFYEYYFSSIVGFKTRLFIFVRLLPIVLSYGTV